MVKKIQINTKKSMQFCVNKFRENIEKIRSNKLSPDMIRPVKIEQDGLKVPLYKMASVFKKDERTLVVTVFDDRRMRKIKQAIISYDAEINISISGLEMFLSFPPITQDRRKKIIQSIRNETEKAKISVRNIRRKSNEEIYSLFKKNKIGRDENLRAKEEIQKMTDFWIKNLETISLNKEKEIMKI